MAPAHTSPPDRPSQDGTAPGVMAPSTFKALLKEAQEAEPGIVDKRESEKLCMVLLNRYMVAQCYENGDGVAKSKERAFHWRKSVAEAIDSQSADVKQAILNLPTSSFNRKLIMSMDYVGKAYFDGDGTTKDVALGISWLDKVCLFSQRNAIYNFDAYAVLKMWGANARMNFILILLPRSPLTPPPRPGVRARAHLFGISIGLKVSERCQRSARRANAAD